MEQIVEIQRCQSSAVLGSGTVGIEATSGFSIGPRDVTPADFLGVGEDTGPGRFCVPRVRAWITRRGRRDSTRALLYLARAIPERPFAGGTPQLAPCPGKAAPPACGGALPSRRKAGRFPVSGCPLLPFPFEAVALEHARQPDNSYPVPPARERCALVPGLCPGRFANR